MEYIVYWYNGNGDQFEMGRFDNENDAKKYMWQLEDEELEDENYEFNEEEGYAIGVE